MLIIDEKRIVELEINNQPAHALPLPLDIFCPSSGRTLQL